MPIQRQSVLSVLSNTELMMSRRILFIIIDTSGENRMVDDFRLQYLIDD